MEFFLPSMLIIILAVGLSILIAPNLSPYALIIGSIVSIFIALYNHYNLFANEYRVMSWLEGAKAFAPSFMSGLVVVLAVGYILFLITKGKMPSIPMPPSSIPPPDTATNTLTKNIGQGLSSLGFASINKNSNRSNNNSNIDESLLSKKF